MYHTTADGKDIYYELRGNTEASETVVFLNGLTQSTQAWSFFVPVFEKRFRIVLLDFVFQGRSSKKGEWRDFDAHAADLKGLLDAEKLCPVHIVGISYGSLVAQHFAVKYPDCLRKLVLLSTFAAKTPYYDAIELAWWHALQSGGYSLMLDVMLPTVLSEEYFSHARVPIETLKSVRKEMNEDPDALLKLMTATKKRKDYRKELRKIVSPTLIVHGEKDLLLPVHMALDVQLSLPGSQLKIIAGAGHTLNLEKAEEAASESFRFLNS